MKRGTPRHRKMRKLAKLLDIPLAHAVGIMEMLWHYAAQETPQGDIGTSTDREIAAAVDWNKKPNVLVDALVEAHWFDRDDTYRLVIHDWPDHAEHAVKQFLKRKGQCFLAVYGNAHTDSTLCAQNEHTDCASREAWLGSDTSSQINEKQNHGNPPRPEPHDFQEFRTVVAEAGGQWSGPDWSEALIVWKGLDFQQKHAAVQGIRERAGTGDFALKAAPKRYLEKRMWERASAKTEEKSSIAQATAKEFYRMKREREERERNASNV